MKTKALWLSLWTAEAAVTGFVSTSSSVLEKASHGFSTGDIVLASALTGGVGGNIVNGRFYYVKAPTANTLEISQTSSFVQETWPEAITALSLARHKELTTTPYKRIKNEWKAPAKGLMEDNTSHSIPCAEGAVINAVGVSSAETVGTLYDLEKVTQETVGASKAYVVSTAQFDLLK